MKLKRLAYAFLAMVMVGSSLRGIIPVIAAGTDDSVRNSAPVELEDGVVLSKTAEPVPGYVNKWKVTLKIEAPALTTTSDTVLVIDRSGSMSGSRLSNAKVAAESLVKELLPAGNTLNRVAVISYGTNVSTDSGFSYDYNTVSSAIDALTAGGGTFTQGGLHTAASLISSSTATYKNIILLSDGVPSYSYAIRGLSVDNSSSFDNTDGPGIRNNEFQTKVVDSVSKFDYTTKVGDGSVSGGDPAESEMWDLFDRKCRETSWFGCRAYDYYYYNHGNAAISEANFYKASNNGGLYTIAFDAETKGDAVLDAMADQGKAYIATDSNLKAIFDEIAGEISELVKSANVHDIMGQGVTVSGTGGTSLDWQPEFKLKNGKYVAETSYDVEMNEDVYNQESSDGFYALNKSAVLTYNDGKTGAFPVPYAKPFAINVKKQLVKRDSAGNESQMADGEEFRFKISGNDKVYSVKSGEQNTIKVPVPIKIGTSYTVTEEAWTADSNPVKFEYYNTEYTGNNFVINGQDDDSIEVVIKNIYETTEVEVSKQWEDDNDRDGIRKNYNNLFAVVKDGEKIVGYKALNTENGTYTIGDLPKYRNGAEIKYSVAEAMNCSGEGANIKCEKFEDDKYSTSVDDKNVITNHHDPETVDLLIEKKWSGEGFTMPGEITVNVSGGDVDREVRIKQTDKVDGKCTEWCVSVGGLYKYEDGKEIEYKVKEVGISGTAEGFIEYGTEQTESGQNSVNGQWDAQAEKDQGNWTVTNTWKPAQFLYVGETDFSIRKLDKNGNPLPGVKFEVNGEEKVTDEDGLIKIEIPVDPLARTEEKTYEITEVETKDGYDLDADKATLNVKAESSLASVDTLQLINNYTKSFTFQASGNAHYTWDGSERMFTLVNERSLAKSLEIEKIFAGISEDALRNSDLSFTISGPEDFEEKTISFSEFVMAGGKATYKLMNLPTGEYTVKEQGGEFEGLLTLEVTGDDGVAKKLEKNEEEKISITNTYEPIRNVQYDVAKIWDDEDNKDGIRPGSLEVDLLADGEVIDTVALDEEMGWYYVWNDLPVANENAEVISYWVEEGEVEGYEQVQVIEDEAGTVFINMHEVEEEEVEPTDPCLSGEGCGKIDTTVSILAPETGKFVKPGVDISEDLWAKNSLNVLIITSSVGAMIALAGVSRLARKKQD